MCSTSTEAFLGAAEELLGAANGSSGGGSGKTSTPRAVRIARAPGKGGEACTSTPPAVVQQRRTARVGYGGGVPQALACDAASISISISISITFGLVVCAPCAGAVVAAAAGSAHVAGECVAVATADSAVKKPAVPAPVAGVWGLVHVKQPALRHCVWACPPLAVGAGVLHCAMDVDGRDVDGSERIFA